MLTYKYTHTPTHIRMTEAYLYYKLNNEPKGSGELILFPSSGDLFHTYYTQNRIDIEENTLTSQSQIGCWKTSLFSALYLYRPRRKLILTDEMDNPSYKINGHFMYT